MELFHGEIIGISGKSGSGKTTLAYALLQLIPIESGEILFDNTKYKLHDLKNFYKLRKWFQIVFQGKKLNDKWKVIKILSEGLILHEPQLNQHERKMRIYNLLDALGLQHEICNSYPYEISGGEYQKISIIRSLLLRPLFLILDEPTSALDMISQNKLCTLINLLRAEHNLSCIIFSHDLKFLDNISDRVLDNFIK